MTIYCCICQSCIKGSHVRTRCSHYFHVQCLRKVRQAQCPLCKKSIKSLLIRIGISEQEQKKGIREDEERIIR